MQMRVVVEPPGVGMQHGTHAEPECLLAVQPEPDQGLRGGFEQRVVDGARVPGCDPAQLRRQRERDQEVGHRQQLVLLTLEPGGRAVLLAAGTASMAARAHLHMRIPTRQAGQYRVPEGSGSAGEHGAQRAPLPIAEPRSVFRVQGRQAGLEDGGEVHAQPSPSIREGARRSASRLIRRR